MKPYIDIADTAEKSAMRMVNRWRVYVYKKCVPNCTQFGTNFCKSLIISIIGGPGGGRTLVQTRKPQAFYMLITD